MYFIFVRCIEWLCYILLFYVTLQNGKSNPETSPRVRSWFRSRVLPFPVLVLVKCSGFLCRLHPVAVAVSALAVAVYSIIYTYVYVLRLRSDSVVWSRPVTTVHVWSCQLLSCHVICCSCICPGCILSCPVSVAVTKRLQLLPLPLRPGPLSRSLITFDHDCSRLLSSGHSRLYPYVFRYKTFRLPSPSLVLVLVTADCSWSDPVPVPVSGPVSGLMYSNYDDHLRRLAIHKTNTIAFR